MTHFLKENNQKLANKKTLTYNRNLQGTWATSVPQVFPEWLLRLRRQQRLAHLRPVRPER